MLIDSHAHLFKEFFDNIDEIIKNAETNGVKKIINCADNFETSMEVVNLSKKYKNVYPTVGIHPENAKDDFNNLDKIEDILKNEKVLAIGEIGLDYYYGKETKEIQLDVFNKHLQLAEKYNLPVVIHSRDASLDTLTTLKKYNVKGIIHCFSGSKEMAKEYIKLGYKLGVNGILTFKNSKNIKEVVREIGLESLVLETDSPFLTPEPYRKYKNEPKYVLATAEYLSDFLNIELEKIQEITTKNVCSIFDI